MERKLQDEIASQGRADDEMMKILADHVATLKISGDKFSADIEKSKPATNAEIIAELLHALQNLLSEFDSQMRNYKDHPVQDAARVAIQRAMDRAEGRAA